MMNKEELKTKLLSFKVFEDNEYLDKYVDLILNNEFTVREKFKTQRHQQGEFSGRRIKRGLYQTKSGKLINADVNGALNILRKSKVVSLETLYNRGDVLTPTRIRLA